MLPQYMDLLNPERQQVFKTLKKFSDDFVLAGGTAISLQIGHRKSFDFDCFSLKELSLNLLPKIKRVFSSGAGVILKTSEMITIRTVGGIEVTFVWHPYKPICPTIKTGYIDIFQLDDLVANKAYTVGRRNTWRDYVDLFFVMHKKIYSLEKIISLAERKFKGEFSSKLFLGQLTYFQDIEIVPVDFINESFTPDFIESSLEVEVKDYLKKLKLW